MERKPEDEKINPELIFRGILSRREGLEPFSASDIEQAWLEVTGKKVPDNINIEKSLETLVERNILAKNEKGLYFELPF